MPIRRHSTESIETSMQAVSYSSTSRRRNAAIAPLLAGTLYIIQAIMGQLWPQAEVYVTRSDYLIEIAFVVALGLTFGGLAALRFTHACQPSRMGTIGFRMATIGTTGMLVSAGTSLVMGQNALGLIFVLGLLGALIGQVIFGINLVRLSHLPWWAGAALIVGLPVSVVLASYGGGAMLGLSWLVLSYHLHTPGLRAAIRHSSYHEGRR
jgi:hypothetical protein